jgi:hypothetical protein
METDSTEVSSPAQQSVAWAWLGAYAGLVAILFVEGDWKDPLGLHGPGLKWICSVPVLVAFLILYRGCVARHWPFWLRIPWLLTVACGLFLWMASFIAWGLVGLFLGFFMGNKD